MDAYVITDLIQASTAAVASVRLSKLGLGKLFPALLAFLVSLALMNLGLGLMDDRSGIYFWTYLALEPLNCIIGVFVVRELFAHTFRDYPGLRSASRWVMYGGIALSLAISLLVTGFFWQGTTLGREHSHLFYFEVSDRAVMLALATAIIVNLVFLSRYPLHLDRNTLVCSAFFSLMFLSQACCLLLDSLAPQLFDRYIDSTEEIFLIACLAGWGWMLSPESAPKPATVRYSTPQEDHLLDQLTLLNQMMTRSARR